MDVLRHDSLQFRSDGVDPQTGILRGRAVLAKEGVYPYSDGVTSWAEFVPMSTLTDSGWLDSLKLSPVTLNHPAEMVTADNARSLAVGAIGDGVVKLDDKIAAPVTVWDRGAVLAAQATHREISLGYWAEVEIRDGTHNGQRYDRVQTRRRANHVALVTDGRHGPQVALHSDCARMDGATIPADDKPANEGKDMERQAKLDAATAELATEKARADKAQADLDAAKAHLDALKSGDKCDNCGAPMKDGKFVKDGLREEVTARIALEHVAADLVKDHDPAGKTDRQIRVDCLAAMGVTVTDAHSDEYVAGRMDAELNHRAGKQTAAQILSAGLKADAAQNKPEPTVDANATMAASWGVKR